MPIQRDIYPDFSDERICSFLNRVDEQKFSDIKYDVEQKRIAEGYIPNGDAKFLNSRKIAMRTYSVARCDLTTPAGRLIRSVDVTDPIDHPITLIVSARLFVAKNLAEVSKKLILDIYQRFDVNETSGSSIDLAEHSILQAGIALQDYQVDLYYEIEKNGRSEAFEINLRSFVQQMQTYSDLRGAPVYEVRVNEGRSLSCNLPDQHFGQSEVIVVPDIDSPQTEIGRLESHRHPDCDGLVLTEHRIGTAFQYYEWKTEWLVRPIRIGRREIMHTKIPVIFSRINKNALWCYAMTTPQIKQNIEKAIIECLIYAALSTAALAVVTGGLGFAAAALAFGEAGLLCIEGKVEDSVRCLFSSLTLVAETDDWQEKVF